MTYVGRVLSGNRVTIPQKYMDILKSKEGDTVIIEFRTAPIGVLIRPAEVMPRDT